MAKLKTGSINKSDLVEYLESQSDFAFEIAALRVLHAHGFNCEHGGSYDDPLTQKSREFDLRATKTFGRINFHLAVECKNLQPHFPLLISCLPRRRAESYHEIIAPTGQGQAFLGPQPRAKAIRLTARQTVYREKERVGKSTAQVGRQNSDNEILSNDSEVYQKWTQAFSSAQDLIDRAWREEDDLHAIFPLLVIPDKTLWLTEFDAAGSRIVDPHQVDRCSYFIDKHYFAGDKLTGFAYCVSHLEFVTMTGLENILDDLFDEGSGVFPINLADLTVNETNAVSGSRADF